MMKKILLAAAAAGSLLAWDAPAYQNVEVTVPLLASGLDVIQEDLYGTTTHERPYGYDVDELVTGKAPFTILYHMGMRPDGTGWQLGFGGDFRGSGAWMAVFAPRYVFGEWHGVHPYLGGMVGMGKDDSPDRDLISRSTPPTLIRGSGADIWGGGVTAGVRKEMSGGFGVGLAYRLDWRQYTLETRESNVAGSILNGDIFDSTFQAVEHLLTLSFSYRF